MATYCWKSLAYCLKKKLSVLSVITLRLLHTKKTHTGAVRTGLPKGVGGHHSAEFECRRIFKYLGCAGPLVFCQLWFVGENTYNLSEPNIAVMGLVVPGIALDIGGIEQFEHLVVFGGGVHKVLLLPASNLEGGAVWLSCGGAVYEFSIHGVHMSTQYKSD